MPQPCALPKVSFSDPLRASRWGLDSLLAPLTGSREEQIEHQLERIRRWSQDWQVDPVMIPLIFDMGLHAYGAAIAYAPEALSQSWQSSGSLPDYEDSSDQVSV